VLIAASAVSLVGLMGIASGSASADVLCDKWTLTNGWGCGTVGGTVYPAGTEIKMKLLPGKQARLDLFKSGEYSEFQCSESALYLKITNPGSVVENVKATVTSFAFASCAGGYTPEVISLGEADIREKSAGTTIGATTLSGTEIRTPKHWMGIKCRVNMSGATGDLVGPVWNKLEASTLTFDHAPVKGECGEMWFSGTYIAQNILGSPTSIYALQF
jgi:hypothetical protein